jgi:PHP family Zn ribbon phosphoesterase
MGLKLFDFVCAKGHTTEKLVNDANLAVQCNTCGALAYKGVSAPRFKLEGFTGNFPTAYDRWEQVRAEKLAIERKQNAE